MRKRLHPWLNLDPGRSLVSYNEYLKWKVPLNQLLAYSSKPKLKVLNLGIPNFARHLEERLTFSTK